MILIPGVDEGEGKVKCVGCERLMVMEIFADCRA